MKFVGFILVAILLMASCKKEDKSKPFLPDSSALQGYVNDSIHSYYAYMVFAPLTKNQHTIFYAENKAGDEIKVDFINTKPKEGTYSVGKQNDTDSSSMRITWTKPDSTTYISSIDTGFGKFTIIKISDSFYQGTLEFDAINKTNAKDRITFRSGEFNANIDSGVPINYIQAKVNNKTIDFRGNLTTQNGISKIVGWAANRLDKIEIPVFPSIAVKTINFVYAQDQLAIYTNAGIPYFAGNDVTGVANGFVNVLYFDYGKVKGKFKFTGILQSSNGTSVEVTDGVFFVKALNR